MQLNGLCSKSMQLIALFSLKKIGYDLGFTILMQVNLPVIFADIPLNFLGKPLLCLTLAPASIAKKCPQGGRAKNCHHLS